MTETIDVPGGRITFGAPPTPKASTHQAIPRISEAEFARMDSTSRLLYARQFDQRPFLPKDPGR